MGRWAQRRIRASSPPEAESEITIVSVTEADLFTLLVAFSAEINSADFNTTDFATFPNGVTLATISQPAADTLELDYSSSLEDETALDYTGSVPGILTPQHVDIT